MSCTIPANPDISGIGVRIAIYVQNFLCFVPAIWAIWDGHVSDYELESAETHSTTNLVLAFAILISCIFQAIGRGLTNYHTSIVLGLSWMNNTNAFVYFLLYVQYKSQGGAGSVEPKWSSWINHGKDTLLTILCVPEGSTLRPSTRKREPSINVAKNAASTVFKRIALSLGSLHLTLMAALGIWLWSSPQSFGAIESAKCATQVADLAVLGARVPFSSQALRIASLTIYSLLLVPGVNLLLPMLLFLSFHCWYQPRPSTPQTLPQHNTDIQPPTPPSTERFSERFRRVRTVCAGLAFLLAINIVFVTDIELTLRRNGGMQEAGESEWGFGQILAILLVFMPLRDLAEAIIRRRQEMQTKLNEALKKAIGDKDLDGMNRWVNAGADPNVRTDDGRTVLEVAMLAEGNASLIQDLVKAGAELNQEFSDGRTALEVAVLAEGNASLIQDLVEAGADVNQELSDGRTALEVAVLAKNLDLVRCLIEAGASVITLLHYASAKDVDRVTVLLESGADPNVQDNYGSTPLHEAAFRGPVDFLKVLLEHGADTSIRNKYGSSALHEACSSDHVDSVTVLLESGADPNIQNHDGNTPLHWATIRGQVDCLKVLLEHRADISIRNKNGATALHWASAKDADSVTVLLESGADPNVRDHDGHTPLHRAALNGDVDCLKVLLEHGADISIQNKSGQTALQTAQERFKGYSGERLPKILELFQSYGVAE